jgi:hypothetical protein
MKYELVFPQPLFEKMRQHLFEGAFTGQPLRMHENACLCLAGLVRGEDKTRFLVREVDIPNEEETIRDGMSVKIKSSVYNRVRKVCQEDRLCIVDVHSHPFGEGFFSGPDLQTLRGAGYWANSLHDQCPMAMLVHGSASAAFKYYDMSQGEPQGNIAELRIVGRQWRRYRQTDNAGVARWLDGHPGRDAEVVKEKIYGRQLLCWGERGQRELQQLHIAILGVGGVGALAAETFARLGVGRLTLVDMDIVTESNLSRLSGAYPSNPYRAGDVGCAKVDVIARHVRKINPDIEVLVHQAEFEDPALESALALTDLLYVAVDSLASRLRAHELATKYLIPAVEVATGIKADLERGIVHQMGSIYQMYIPGSNGCRYCRPEMVMAHGGGAGVQGPRGYVWGTELNPEAAILPQNAFINALACHQIAKYITGFGEPVDRIRYDGINETLTKVRRSLNPECALCGAGGRLALGQFGRLGNLDALLAADGRTEDDARREAEILGIASASNKAAAESRTAYRHVN